MISYVNVWVVIAHKIRQVISGYGWPLATALTLMAGLEPLLHLSHLAHLVVIYWVTAMGWLWKPVFYLLGISISPNLFEPLTLALLYLISGFVNNQQVRVRFGATISDFAMPWLVGAYLINAAFFLFYGTLRLLPVVKAGPSDAEFYLLGLAVFAFVLTLALSMQKPLLRNIALTITYVLILVALDRLYAPLERFLS